jgi:hypothetical protein
MANAQRRATKRYRERTRKRGLKRLEVRVPVADVPVIRKVAAILRDQPREATLLREHVGLSPSTSPAMSALDVFAMTEPLSPEGEALWDEAMAQVERERRDPLLNRARDVDL